MGGEWRGAKRKEKRKSPGHLPEVSAQAGPSRLVRFGQRWMEVEGQTKEDMVSKVSAFCYFSCWPVPGLTKYAHKI